MGLQRREPRTRVAARPASIPFASTLLVHCIAIIMLIVMTSYYDLSFCSSETCVALGRSCLLVPCTAAEIIRVCFNFDVDEMIIKCYLFVSGKFLNCCMYIYMNTG